MKRRLREFDSVYTVYNDQVIRGEINGANDYGDPHAYHHGKPTDVMRPVLSPNDRFTLRLNAERIVRPRHELFDTPEEAEAYLAKLRKARQSTYSHMDNIVAAGLRAILNDRSIDLGEVKAVIQGAVRLGVKLPKDIRETATKRRLL